MARVELEILTLINSGKIDAAVKKAEGEMARLTQLARAGSVVAGGRPGAAGGLGGFAGIAAMQGLTDVAAQLRAGMLRNLSAFKGQAPKLADLNKTLDQVKQEYLKLTGGGAARNQERVAAFNRQVAARKEEIAPTPPRAPAPVKPPLSPAQIAFDERRAAREALDKAQKKEDADRHRADQQARRNIERADGGRAAANRAGHDEARERFLEKQEADRQQLETRRKGQAAGAQRVADQAAGRAPLPPSQVPVGLRPRLTPEELRLMQQGRGDAWDHGLRATMGRAGVPFQPLVDPRGRATPLTKEAGLDVLRQVDEDLRKWRMPYKRGGFPAADETRGTAIKDLETVQSGLRKVLGLESQQLQAKTKAQTQAKTEAEVKATTPTPKGPPFTDAEARAFRRGQGDTSSPAYKAWLAQESADVSKAKRAAAQPKPVELTPDQVKKSVDGLAAKMAERAAKTPTPPSSDPTKPRREQEAKLEREAQDRLKRKEAREKKEAEDRSPITPTRRGKLPTIDELEERAKVRAKGSKKESKEPTEKEPKEPQPFPRSVSIPKSYDVTSRLPNIGTDQRGRPLPPGPSDRLPSRVETAKINKALADWGKTDAQLAQAKKAATERALAADATYIPAQGVLNAATRRRALGTERATISASKGLVEEEAQTKALRDVNKRHINARARQIQAAPFSPYGAVPLGVLGPQPTRGQQGYPIPLESVRKSLIQAFPAAAPPTPPTGPPPPSGPWQSQLAALGGGGRPPVLGPHFPISQQAAVQEAAAVRDAVNAATKRVGVAKAVLTNEQQLRDLKAQEIVATRQALQAERQAAQAVIKQLVATNKLSRGTAIQRFQAAIASRAGGPPRLPTDFGTGAQVLGGGLLTTARFAISGAALYGVFSGITKSIKAAEDLERIFNQINRQFESLGKHSEFGGFRNEILAIARDTGSAAAEVASVGFQLQGAFGGNTLKALHETRSAFEAVKVTGLSITEVIDAFTALTQNFREANVTISQVSDKALGLQERFGVLAKETISFSSDLAPVASQAGFTVEQLESLGAVAQKYSGRSGSNLAEAFGRIIPTMSQNAEQFVGLFEQIGGLDLGAKVAEAFRTGNTAEFFTTLLQNYPKLSKAQKDYVIQLLGGRREAQSLIPVLEHSTELLGEFALGQSDAGKTSQYYGDLQRTLKQQLQQLGETLTQVGVQLFEGGLGQFLKDVVGLGNKAVSVLKVMLEVLTAISSVIGSLPGVGSGLGFILEGVAAFAAVRGGAGFIKGAAAAGAGKGLLSRVGGGLAGAGATIGVGAIGGRLAAGREAYSVARQGGNWVAGGALGAGRVAGLRAAGNALLPSGLAVALAAIAVNWWVDTAQDWNAKLEAAAEKLDNDVAAALKAGADQATVIAQAQAAGGDTFTNSQWQDVALSVASLGFIDVKAQSDRVVDEIQQTNSGRQLDELRVLGRAGRYGGLDKNAFQKILDSSGRGDIKAYDDLEEVFNAFREDPTDNALNEVVARLIDASRSKSVEIARLLDLAPTQRDPFQNAAAAIIRAAQAKSVEQIQQVQEILDQDAALAQFEAGDIGYGPAKRALDTAIRRAEQIGWDKAPPGDPNRDKYNKYIKQRSGFMSQAFLNQAKGLSEEAELFGGGGEATATTQIDSYLAAIRSKTLNKADTETATKGVLGGLKALRDARLAAADSAEEQAKIMAEGIAVPEEIQVELIYGHLSNFSIGFQQFLDGITLGNAQLTDAITRGASEIFAKGNVTLQQAIIQSIQMNRKILEAQKHSLEETLTFIATNGGSAEGVAGIQAQIDAIDKGLTELDQGVVPDVTVPDYTRAGVDTEGAAKKNRDIAIAVQKARLDLQKAMVEGSPVDEAKIAQQQADYDAEIAAAAGDTAGQLQAQAARIRADRTLQQAMQDIGNAQIELAIAMAEAGDDVIKASDLQVDLARKRLADLQANAPGDTAGIDRAQAEVVRAETAARKSRISEGEAAIRTSLDLERISKGQAIAQLEALKQFAKTQKEIDQIDLEIKQLRDQLGQDFQFNIPSAIGLPTLYEARRLNQTPGGQSYQDNSQVVINFTANNTADAQAIANTIVDGFGGPSRFGTDRGAY